MTGGSYLIFLLWLNLKPQPLWHTINEHELRTYQLIKNTIIYQLCRGFAPVGIGLLSLPNKSSSVLFPSPCILLDGAGAGASNGSGVGLRKFDLRVPSVSGVYCTKSKYVRTARRRLLPFTFRIKIMRKTIIPRAYWKFKCNVSGESYLELAKFWWFNGETSS